MAESSGFLQVFVRTADGALPVAAARVRIFGGDVDRTEYTDRSGKTPRVALPAPSAKLSQSSENKTPFALYGVTVTKEGFYTQSTENVPIFDGVSSLQPVLLIGLAEYGSAELVPESSVDTVKTDPQALNR